MNTTADQAYIDRILVRMRAQYITRTPRVPGGRPISFWLLARLRRYVRAEGYGL